PGLIAKRLLAGGRNLDPLLVRRGVVDVAVVPVPPLVGLGLRIACGGILPKLLPAKRRDVEVVPGAAHLLVAAALDEIGPENPVTLAEEYVGAVPFVDAEVGIKTISDGEPRDVPAHARLQPGDVRLRRSR